jgi:hypothetical protein
MTLMPPMGLSNIERGSRMALEKHRENQRPG